MDCEADFKKRKEDEFRDRISNLPSRIIDVILGKLPLCEAVRSSILSRSWRYKWTTNPTLVLKYPFTTDMDYISVVDRLLSQQLHPGTLSKVAIELGTYNGALHNHHVDSWIHHLSHHPIRDLSLSLFNIATTMTIPPRPSLLMSSRHLFSNSFNHLERLHLGHFRIKPPPDYSGFSKLVTLALWYVKILFDQDLGFILSKCPVLNRLLLNNVMEPERVSTFLNISAPNLSHFSYTGSFIPSHFASANLKTITLAYNSLAPPVHGCDGSKMVELFGQLVHIQQVQLHNNSLKFLSIGGVVQRLAKDLNCLTHLKSDLIDFREMDNVVSALCLIKSSPNLKRLQLGCCLYLDSEEDPSVIQYLRTQQMCGFSHSHLKTVEMVNVNGFKAEREFIKLILWWATTLEKLNITFDVSATFSKAYKLVQEAASYRRASPTVVVEFDESCV